MIQIETLTHHAMGRATDGTLIARTLPGEQVDPEGRILTPSPDRVAPACAHFKSCGGCDLQHAKDAFVAAWKVEVVRKALEGQGLPQPMRRLHVSPPQTRRRAKFSARKTKKGALVGFHARASDQIFAVPGCQVLSPALLAVVPALEQLVRILASRSTELGLTVTHSPAGIDLWITGGPEPTAQNRVDISAWAEAHDIARVTLGDETIVTRRAPVQQFGGVAVTPPPGAFLQATPQGEAALSAAVVEAVGPADRIVDLFCGAGTFTLPLAQCAQVHGVEGLGQMTAALDHAWRHASGLHQVSTETRDLFRRPLLPDELRTYGAAVLDPPRAGAEAQIRQIAEGGPPRLAYVSCNPISFARDARILIAAGYELSWVDVVDQFRWSTHIELAAQFLRRSRP